MKIINKVKFNKILSKLYLAIIQIIVILGISSFSLAISVSLPQQNNAEDVIIDGPSVIDSQESYLFKLIQIINKYLWFILGAIAMGVLVYAGIKLITAEGKQEEMTKVHKMLMGIVIGIVIAILSYAIVRLLVNIF